MLSGDIFSALSAEAMIKLACEYEATAAQLRGRAADRMRAGRPRDVEDVERAMFVMRDPAYVARQFGTTPETVEAILGASKTGVAAAASPPANRKAPKRALRAPRARKTKNAAHELPAAASAPAAMSCGAMPGDDGGPILQAEPSCDSLPGVLQLVAAAPGRPILPDIQPALVDEGLPAPREAVANHAGHALKFAGPRILSDQHQAARERVRDERRKQLPVWLGKARADLGEVIPRPRL